VLSSCVILRIKHSDIEFILSTLGRLWLSGIQVDWAGFYKDELRHRISLPTYPFERQRYWAEAQQPTRKLLYVKRGCQKKSDIAECFYLPSWKRSFTAQALDGKDLRIKSFVGSCLWMSVVLGPRLLKQLEQQGQEVIAVKIGEKFAPVGQGIYTINPGAKEDYSALIKEMDTRGRFPKKSSIYGVSPK